MDIAALGVIKVQTLSISLRHTIQNQLFGPHNIKHNWLRKFPKPTPYLDSERSTFYPHAMLLSDSWSDTESQYHPSESWAGGSNSVCLWAEVTWFQCCIPALHLWCGWHETPARSPQQQTYKHTVLSACGLFQQIGKTRCCRGERNSDGELWRSVCWMFVRTVFCIFLWSNSAVSYSILHPVTSPDCLSCGCVVTDVVQWVKNHVRAVRLFSNQSLVSVLDLWNPSLNLQT